MTITPGQCRAARALLYWSQPTLAEATGIARETIAHFERGARAPYPRNLATIRAALEAAGIEFIDPNGGGPGVRLRE
jgi:transcriptional regulator with XRE-family HTH domain